MKGYTGLLLLMCLLVSCGKPDNVQTTKVGNSKPNIQMILTAKEVYNTNPYKDRPMAGVSVQVYGSESNRTYHRQLLKYGLTDSLGRVYFEYLDEQDYFVEGTIDGKENAEIKVTYPGGAVTAFEDLLMLPQ